MAKLIVEEIKPDELEYITESKNGQKFHYITGPFMRAEIVNGNGRLYPLSIMEKEIDRYSKNYVNEGRAFGELGHPDCYLDENVEVLTKNGWSLLKDTTVGEQVYTINPITHKIELNNVSHVTNEPYNGKALHIFNRNFDVLVTPNHRFPLIKRDGSLEMVFAENLMNEDNHSYIPRIFSEIEQSDIENNFFEINENLKIDIHIFSAFMGLYLSEGNTYKAKNRPHTYVISIFQNEGEKADIIQELLDKFPIKFNRYQKGKKITWKIGNRDLGEYLHQFGTCYDKYIDKKLIEMMDKKSANLFIDFFVLGDGRGNRNNTYSKSDIFSTSEKLIDDVSQVAFVAGYSTRKYKVIPEKDIKIEGRIIKAENKHPLYFLYFMRSRGIYTDNRFLNIEEIDNFIGNKYCITVPNGTFYARSNGYTFWSGNSPKINLERTSHLITSLTREGNDFIGKARVMDTPYGKIVQNILEAGGKLGVSSRGLGSLKEQNGVNVVQDDFELRTAADVVADPSAPDAFVTGLMENVEWVKDEALGWKALEKAEDYKKYIGKEYKRLDEEKKLKIFTSFIKSL